MYNKKLKRKVSNWCKIERVPKNGTTAYQCTDSTGMEILFFKEIKHFEVYCCVNLDGLSFDQRLPDEAVKEFWCWLGDKEFELRNKALDIIRNKGKEFFS